MGASKYKHLSLVNDFENNEEPEMNSRTNTNNNDLWQSHNSLRDEQHRHEDRLARALESIKFDINQRFDKIENKIDSFETKLEAKISFVETKLDNKFDALNVKIETTNITLSNKIEAINTTLNDKIESLAQRSFNKKDAWIMFLFGVIIIILLMLFLPNKTTNLLIEIINILSHK